MLMGKGSTEPDVCTGACGLPGKPNSASLGFANLRVSQQNMGFFFFNTKILVDTGGGGSQGDDLP